MNTYSGFYKGLGIDSHDENGFDAMSNVDTSTSLGTVQAQFALAADNSTITENCYQAQDKSGNGYFFSATSGKTWKRAVGTGIVTLVNTNTNGAHLNARFFNNKIYYCTISTMGVYEILSGVFTDSFHTFVNAATYHPMEEVNAILHIGDGKDIVSLNVSANKHDSALDLPADYTCTALLNENSYLLNGSRVGTTVYQARIFYWDTYSSSWTLEDDVQAINFFIKVDNYTFVQAGTEGMIYNWDGNKAVKWKPLRGVTSDVSVQATTQLGDKTLFAIGATVYSLYQKSGSSGFAITPEYTAPANIQSIMAIGSTLLVSANSLLYTFSTSRATATITTPITDNTFDYVEAEYEALNGGTFSLETNINGAGWVTESGFVNDSTNNKYVLLNGISYAGHVNYGQSRVTIIPSGASSPTLKVIRLESGNEPTS
jgi:hypothetical protein